MPCERLPWRVAKRLWRAAVAGAMLTRFMRERRARARIVICALKRGAMLAESDAYGEQRARARAARERCAAPYDMRGALYTLRLLLPSRHDAIAAAILLERRCYHYFTAAIFHCFAMRAFYATLMIIFALGRARAPPLY